MAKSEAVKDPAVKGKLKLILLLVLALLLAIGLSVGATWFFLQRGDSKPQVDPATVSNVRPAAIYEPLAPAFVGGGQVARVHRGVSGDERLYSLPPTACGA